MVQVELPDGAQRMVSACTAPSPFWKAMAPSSAQTIMSLRAALVAAVAHRRHSARQPRVSPSMAMASAGGLKAGAIKVSSK